MTRLRIAQAQINPTVGDIGGQHGPDKGILPAGTASRCRPGHFSRTGRFRLSPGRPAAETQVLKGCGSSVFWNWRNRSRALLCLVGYPERKGDKVYKLRRGSSRAAGSWATTARSSCPTTASSMKSAISPTGSGCTVLDFGGHTAGCHHLRGCVDRRRRFGALRGRILPGIGKHLLLTFLCRKAGA